MFEFSKWQGYLVNTSEKCYFISSPWSIDGSVVFGPDSDHNTLAVSLVQFMNSIGIEVESLQCEDSQIDMNFLNIALRFDENISHGEWTIYCSSDASLSISKSKPTKFPIPENLTEIDKSKYDLINKAWKKETAIENVSQGAYISSQQYSESLGSRINLTAQSGNQNIWPPRILNEQGDYYGSEEFRLSNVCNIESWTKLSAAGAPSEFSIRAPILGGISTAYVSFEYGIKGVFLLVDDEGTLPKIGSKGEIVVRRIYGQEGQMRYGTKLRIID